MSMNNLKLIRKSINLTNDKWNNIETTNCYAFALGIDMDKNIINKYAYNPGVISNSKINLAKYTAFNYEDLLYNIINDLKYLNINYEEINPNDLIDINEWKVAIFLKYYKCRCTNLITDYHFLREINGIWYHKQGFNSYPTNLDSDNKIIDNLANINITDYEYKSCYKLKLR